MTQPNPSYLVSVNVGLPRPAPWKNRTVVTGIFKEPVTGPVVARRLNLDGDRQADLSVHGGEDKAIYVYPAEHYEPWRRELETTDLPWGMFGENYNTFATKQELLAAVCTAWLEEAEVRPLIVDALAQADDHSKIERAARWSRQMHERGLEVETLFEAAYWEDPELRSMFDRWGSERKAAMGQVITTLNLRPDLTAESAVALFLALSSAQVYRELVEGAGWLPRRYEDWLGETLAQQLLAAHTQLELREGGSS